MDTAMLREHLAQAEAHIALGLAHIDKQRRIISRLYDKGVDPTSARDFLAKLEDAQAMHEAYRERIQHELDRR